LSRHYVLPNHQRVIFSDTVGFLHALPHGLVEAFHATLEEVLESDLLVLVLDISHPKFLDFYQSVMRVLKEIGAEEKKIVIALNKIDKIDSQSDLEKLSRSFTDPVFVSAKSGYNIDLLVEKISDVLAERSAEIEVHIPLSRMDIVNLIHEQGQVHAVDYGDKEVKIWATVPNYLASRLSNFLK
jgi:GTPase